MNKQLLFTDETEEYVVKAEDGSGRISIRFRTAKDDVKRVEYVKKGEEPRRMLRVSSDEYFDYYEAEQMLSDEPLWYYFLISDDSDVVFYDKLGVSHGHNDDFDFCIIPGFTVPEWARGVIMYQIFADRFCNGNLQDDTRTGEYEYLDRPVVYKDEWNTFPERMDVGNFHGGDLQGVIDKLDYLKSLSVGAIYLNPIFDSPSNHKYDCRDYTKVDKHLGDNAKLAELIGKAHEKGIRVILDGVFNHTSIEHRWVSEHPEYYVHETDGRLSFWWGMETLPKLNYENEELVQEILDIAKMYLMPPYNADGWRIDVPADLGETPEANHRFWKAFRKAVKETGDDKLIVAEHYYDPRPWLMGDEWDSIMNYTGFMDPIDAFLVGVDKHSDNIISGVGNGKRFMGEMVKAKSYLTEPSYMTAMNELDNHDHSRFLTRTKGRTGRLGPDSSEDASAGIRFPILRQAATIQYSWQGMPTIYYGDEAGMCGWTDPDSRRAYPWGCEDYATLNFYRRLGEVHEESRALKYGSLIPLIAEDGMIAYARKYKDEVAIVLVHTGEEKLAVNVPLVPAGVKAGDTLKRVILTDNYGYDLNEVDSYVDKNTMYIEMLPNSAFVFILV